MATEVEAKFLAAGPEPLERLVGASHLGRASLGAPVAFEEVDRYLDTDDGRLETAGWACRLRSRNESVRVSLKGPPEAANGGWLHHRPEVEAPAVDSLDPRAWPTSDARALLDRLRGGGALRERFRLLQRRTERGVELDGRRIGTLSLDTVSIRHGGDDAGGLFAIELELDADAEASTLEALTELGSVLAAQPGVEPDERTKLQHALTLIASR